MANEATITAQLTYTKGGVNLGNAFQPAAHQPDVSGIPYVAHVQNISAADYVALDMGSVTSPGWTFMRNLDSANYVEIKGATGDTNPMLKLKAGESQVFRMLSTAPYAKANTAAVNLEYVILSD